VDKLHLDSVRKNYEYNDYILGYYTKLMNDKHHQSLKFTLQNKLESIRTCNQFWLVDRYDIHRVKDFIKTNLCKDKFCHNCKKVKQASRMSRFIPEIERHKDLNLYHVVFTSPNVPGHQLSETIQKQFSAFTKITQYLKSNKGRNIRGLDFDSWGYQGAIRSLEVTYKGDSYHPHLHVLLAMEGEISEKNHTNPFSKRHGKIVRNFADEEILLQKIFYLLMNGQRVTLKAIENLDLGYSCMMDKFKEDDYFELFKYMTNLTDQKLVNL